MEEIANVSLAKLHGRLGTIAYQLAQLSLSHSSPPCPWYPPLNVFLCHDKITVCIDLAGVDPREIDLKARSRSLCIRGRRVLPQPCGGENEPREILAMEIDYGPFERTVEFPVHVQPEHVTAEQRNGILWVVLPLQQEG